MSASPLILIVEDEPVICVTLEDAFQDAGYEVLSASLGADALALMEEYYAQLCGLVTDIRLGDGPDGWALAHRARELNPNIAIVYASGDSAADWSAQGVPKSIMLQKPFAEAQAVTAISTLLNEAG